MKNELIKQVIHPSSPIKNKPHFNSELETECLYGEQIKILDEKKDWKYCESLLDGYKGWIHGKTISKKFKTTHKIKVLKTDVYKLPNIKSKIFFHLFINSTVEVVKILGDWSEVKIKNKIGYIFSKHLLPKNRFNKDWINVAYSFLGVPYTWGGKTSMGVDCSGLIQIILESNGLKISRNTDDQKLTSSKNFENQDYIQKGCLVFWKGHIGLTLSNSDIIHSSAHHMNVVIEKLEQTKKRFYSNVGEILLIKKIRFR